MTITTPSTWRTRTPLWRRLPRWLPAVAAVAIIAVIAAAVAAAVLSTPRHDEKEQDPRIAALTARGAAAAAGDTLSAGGVRVSASTQLYGVNAEMTSVYRSNRSSGVSELVSGGRTGEVILSEGRVFVDNSGGILGALGVEVPGGTAGMIELTGDRIIDAIFPVPGSVSVAAPVTVDDDRVTGSDGSEVIFDGDDAVGFTSDTIRGARMSSVDRIEDHPVPGTIGGVVDAEGTFTPAAPPHQDPPPAEAPPEPGR